MNIPADMNVAPSGQPPVVSIRDLLVLLGTSDEKLRDMDERDAVLAREPWRWDTLVSVVHSWWGDSAFTTSAGEADMRGTRFDTGTKTVWDCDEKRTVTGSRDVPKDPVEDALPYIPLGRHPWLGGRKRGDLTPAERLAHAATWLEGHRPDAVRALAAAYPLGTAVETGGGVLWVVGWTDIGYLIVTPVDPDGDFEEMLRTMTRIPAGGG
jgi:hypothetical protein